MFGFRKAKDGSKIKVGKPVSVSSLTKEEKRIWDMKDVVFKSIGGLPEGYQLKIVEIIDYEKNSVFTYGLCDWDDGVITISRMALRYPELFLGVLLHEIAHAKSESTDETKPFEQSLTDLLGLVSSSLVSAVGGNPNKVKEAESMDFKGAGYMKCRCMSCEGIDFEYNDDITYVKCKKCGREYKGGYDELVELNKKFIEENLTQDEINAECVHDVINEDDKHSFDMLSKTEHLLVCGVPLDGTPMEMIKNLSEAGIIDPINEEIQKIICSINDDEVQIYNNNFKGVPAEIIYLVKNRKGKVKQIMVSMPLMKDLGEDVSFLGEMLKPHYGKGLQVSPNFITWTFRNGKIIAANMDEVGLCLSFKDKANADPGDEE